MEEGAAAARPPRASPRVSRCATMQDRAVAAVRQRDEAIEAEHGPSAVWAVVSHGDVIKSILADAVGSHLDQFQRIVVDPASVSIVRFTAARPFVLTVNSHARRPVLARAPAQDGSGAEPQATGTRRSGAAPVRHPLGPRPRLVDMPLVHSFDPPDRFVTGTVGEPGARTFFLRRAGAAGW